MPTKISKKPAAALRITPAQKAAQTKRENGSYKAAALKAAETKRRNKMAAMGEQSAPAVKPAVASAIPIAADEAEIARAVRLALAILRSGQF